MKEYILSETEKAVIHNFLSMLTVWRKEFRADSNFTSAIDAACITDDVIDFCKATFENYNPQEDEYDD